MDKWVLIYDISVKVSGGMIEFNIVRLLYLVVVNIVLNILKMVILKLMYF